MTTSKGKEKVAIWKKKLSNIQKKWDWFLECIKTLYRLMFQNRNLGKNIK